jgi:hypothetical protein
MTAAGLIVKLSGELYFLPAELSLSVLARPVVSRVPGTKIGMTLFGGRVIPVIELGADPRDLVVCDSGGEAVALGGLEVLEAGFFEWDDEQIVHAGRRIEPLDVVAELERAERLLLSPRPSSGARS